MALFSASRDAQRTFPKVAADERIYAIGDIHGRFDLMIKLLDQIVKDANRFQDERNARIVFMGDYIDRGDASADVLDALADLNDTPDHTAVFLLGNHEDAMLAFLDAPHQGEPWLAMGGQQTLASYGLRHVRPTELALDPLKIRDELEEAASAHLDFLGGLRTSFRSGDVFFSHAGVDPGRALDSQSRDAMVWGHPQFLQDWPIPDHRVVHGHFDDPEPVTRPGRICVDSGAYYSGVLTAVRLDDGEAFLSTAD